MSQTVEFNNDNLLSRASKNHVLTKYAHKIHRTTNAD